MIIIIIYFFRNLEVIGGRTLTEYFSVYIVKTSLTSLGLQSLKKISSGSIGILENKDLCYAEGVAWSKIGMAAGHRTIITQNKGADECGKWFSSPFMATDLSRCY